MQNSQPTYHVELSDGQRFELCLDLGKMKLSTYQHYKLASAKFEALHSKDDPESLIALAAVRVELMQVIAPEIDWANHPDLLSDSINDAIRTVIDLIEKTVTAYDAKLKAKNPNFEKSEIEVNGEVYTLPVARALHYLELVPAVTANEICEVLTMKEEFEKLAQSANMVQLYEGRYQISMKQLAVLYRKEGEALPLEADTRRKFILERAKLFEDCPASVALDSAFFLTGLSSAYAVATLQSLSQPPTTSKAKKRKMQAQGKSNSQKRKDGTMSLAKSPQLN